MSCENEEIVKKWEKSLKIVNVTENEKFGTCNNSWSYNVEFKKYLTEFWMV